MDVTPQTLHDAEFREAKRGGYHHGDVDEFLEKVAIGVEALHADIAETRRRMADAESRAAAAESRLEQAERRLAETGGVDDSLKRTLVLAQRTADAAIAEAEEQAARTVAAAEEQSSRMLAEARDAVARARSEAEAEARRSEEETRAAVLAELHELESSRDALRADVDAYEQHLEHQRSQVRSTADELHRLLDDPDALRLVPAPPITDIGPVPERPRPLVADPTPDELAAGAAEAQGQPEPAPAGDDRYDAYEAAPPTEPEAWPEPEPERGQATQPVDVLAERDADDDAYLAELRKAMTDESPLGPRDESDDPGSSDMFDTESDRSGRSRFGRRG